MVDKTNNKLLQSNLDYLDLDYPDYSIIWIFSSGPNFFMNINYV